MSTDPIDKWPIRINRPTRFMTHLELPDLENKPQFLGYRFPAPAYYTCRPTQVLYLTCAFRFSFTYLVLIFYPMMNISRRNLIPAISDSPNHPKYFIILYKRILEIWFGLLVMSIRWLGPVSCDPSPSPYIMSVNWTIECFSTPNYAHILSRIKQLEKNGSTALTDR